MRKSFYCNNKRTLNRIKVCCVLILQVEYIHRTNANVFLCNSGVDPQRSCFQTFEHPLFILVFGFILK